MATTPTFNGLAGGTDGKYLKDDFTWDTPAGGVSSANVQAQTYTYYSDTGAADAYVITPNPAIGSYAAGQRFQFLAGAANTGASTLNVNALGAKAIKKQHDTALAANDIEAGSIVDVIYDGTNFQMVSMVATNAGSNWTDGGTYLKPATDGDTVRVYDSGGTKYSNLSEDVLSIQERSSAPSTAANHFQIYGITTSPVAIVDETATMESNSTPSPNVTSASTEYDASFAAWKAFDKNAATSWSTTNGSIPAWIKYDFGSGNEKAAVAYTITARADPNHVYAPKDFTFEGSNNDSSWTTLDTQTGITFTDGQKKSFYFTNVTSYRYFRLSVSASYSGSYVQTAEIEISEVGVEGGYKAYWKDPGGTEHEIA